MFKERQVSSRSRSQDSIFFFLLANNFKILLFGHIILKSKYGNIILYVFIDIYFQSESSGFIIVSTKKTLEKYMIENTKVK